VVDNARSMLPDESQWVTVEDVQERIRLYSELVELQEAVLGRMRQAEKNQPEAFRKEVEAADIRPIQGLIAEYRDRLGQLRRGMISVLPN
jgi:hypothetical protein